MNRNVTPRMVKAAGAKDAHGSILDGDSGAMYVHVHRESGLAHRHYVLKPWQVRLLAVAISRPMLLFYVAAIVTWGWMASRALVQVPLLVQRVGTLTRDAQRLDTLTAKLSELQARYDQVQTMLSAQRAGAKPSTEPVTETKAPNPVRPAPAADSTKRPAPMTDTTKRPATTTDTTRRPQPPRN